MGSSPWNSTALPGGGPPRSAPHNGKIPLLKKEAGCRRDPQAGILEGISPKEATSGP